MQESKLARTLYIDRAVYRVDDRMKTYQYLHRNPEWERLSRKRNEANKKAIDGYTRVSATDGPEPIKDQSIREALPSGTFRISHLIFLAP